jgi:hypothetical protein
MLNNLPAAATRRRAYKIIASVQVLAKKVPSTLRPGAGRICERAGSGGNFES